MTKELKTLPLTGVRDTDFIRLERRYVTNKVAHETEDIWWHVDEQLLTIHDFVRERLNVDT